MNANELLKGLQDVDLRVTQAIIASGILGKKKSPVEFLLGELERIRTHVRCVIANAGGQSNA